MRQRREKLIKGMDHRDIKGGSSHLGKSKRGSPHKARKLQSLSSTSLCHLLKVLPSDMNSFTV